MCSSLTLNDNVTEEIYGTMNLKDDGWDKGSYCTIDSNHAIIFSNLRWLVFTLIQSAMDFLVKITM